VSRADGGVLCVGLAFALALAVAPIVQGCASSGGASLGGLSPYRVNGTRYVPLRDWQGYEEEGIASWYGAAHHGKKTARSRTSATAGASSSASTTADRSPGDA
jgi:hypothetical protein